MPPPPPPHDGELLEELLDPALLLDDVTCSHQLFDLDIAFSDLVADVFNASIYHDDDGSRPLKTGGTFVKVIVYSLMLVVLSTFIL